MPTSRPSRTATRPNYLDLSDSDPDEDDYSLHKNASKSNRSSTGKRGSSSSRSNKAPKIKSNKKTRRDDSEEDDDALLSSDDDSGCKGKGKGKQKAKKTTSKKKKGKGKASLGSDHFSKLPLELLAEIFSYVSPKELLSLSLTSSGLRTTLLSPSNGSLWAASRRAVGLPDLKTGDVSELQYANLMYNKSCQGCDGGKVQDADFFLRKRLCRSCREANWIKLSEVNRDYPNLHPLAKDSVLHSLHGPADTFWTGSKRYVRWEDLEIFSQRLRELAKADATDAEEHKLELIEQRRAQREAERVSVYVEIEEDEDDYEPDEIFHGPRVLAFVEERAEFKAGVEKDAEAVCKAKKSVYFDAYFEMRAQRNHSRQESGARRVEIQRRVLLLDEYSENDFEGLWYRSTVIKKGEAVTDENWEQLKPKVSKVIARVRSDREAETKSLQQNARQKSLKSRYKKLRKSLASDELRNSMPLFADFLHLPTVKTMWELEDSKQDKATFKQNVDSIMEELDEYRIDVRLEAIRTILRATTTMSKEEVDNIDSDELISDEYDDAFLERATSALVCNLPDCYRYSFGGTLNEVLKHQHQRHGEYKGPAPKKRQKTGDGVVGHFALSDTVAFAISASLEAIGLDYGTTTFDDLRKESDNGVLVWENRMRGGKIACNIQALLHLVVMDQIMADKAKYELPIPTIAWTSHVKRAKAPSRPSNDFPVTSSPATFYKSRSVISDSDSDDGGGPATSRVKEESDDDGALAFVKEEDQDDEHGFGMVNDSDDDEEE